MCGVWQNANAGAVDSLTSWRATSAASWAALLLSPCREACLEVEGMRLQRLEPGVPLTLEALTSSHEKAVAGAAERLEQVGVGGALGAC